MPRYGYMLYCSLLVGLALSQSVDLTNKAMLDRIWPILSNKEAVRMNVTATRLCFVLADSVRRSSDFVHCRGRTVSVFKL